MFRLDQVSKTIGDRSILSNLSLHLESGLTHALIGPSGCGKSTLLKLLLGIVTPTSGSVLWQETDLRMLSLKQLRRRVGYVIQSGGLFPHLTVRANILLAAEYQGWNRERCQARLDELLAVTQLPTEFLSRYPLQLSGGQRQRVSLMRALMLDPEALLLDEPLGALDPIVRSQLQSDLLQLFRKLKKTVVMVTHDVHEAVYLADNMILLRDGQLIQQGAFDQFMHHPCDPFVTEFLGAQRHAFALPTRGASA